MITSKGDPASLSGECWRPLALRTLSSWCLDGCFHVSYWIPWDLQRTNASPWQIRSRLVFALRSPREPKIIHPSHLCTDNKSAQLRRVPAEETGLPTGLQMSIAVSRCRLNTRSIAAISFQNWTRRKLIHRCASVLYDAGRRMTSSCCHRLWIDEQCKGRALDIGDLTGLASPSAFIQRLRHMFIVLVPEEIDV